MPINGEWATRERALRTRPKTSKMAALHTKNNWDLRKENARTNRKAKNQKLWQRMIYKKKKEKKIIEKF